MDNVVVTMQAAAGWMQAAAIWVQVAVGLLLAATAFAAWRLNKKWGREGRVQAAWLELPRFRLDLRSQPRTGWLWRLVWRIQPFPIFAAEKRVLRLVVLNAPRLQLDGDYGAKIFAIEEGFACDGASIPALAKMWLDRLWLMEAGVAHDALYAQQVGRALADEAFYSLARRAHGRLAARMAWIALRAAGGLAYWQCGRELRRAQAGRDG